MADTPIRNNLILELHVPDFTRAREFYGLFDFKELLFNPSDNDGRAESERLGYLVLKRTDPIGTTLLNFYGGDASIVNQPYFARFPATSPRGYGVEISIPVQDIQTLWSRVLLTVPELSVAEPLTLQPWGKLDFRVVDPFGFYVRFTELVDWGQSLERLPPA